MTLETAGFPRGIVEEEAVFARRIAAFPEGFLLAGDPAWGYFCAEIWSGWDPLDHQRFHLGHDIEAYLDRGGETLYIASMTVAPAVRGGGRGRDLFRTGLSRLGSEFPGLRSAVLIVNEHWASARRIYSAEGFLEVGRIPEFFQPLDQPFGDAVIMERKL